jgi:hypothetical protein
VSSNPTTPTIIKKGTKMLETMLAPSPKRVIHKFPVHSSSEIQLGMPAKFLYVAMQGDYPQLWVQHCPDSHIQATAQIRTFATGQEIPEGFEFLGTWLDGSYVWHAYAKADKK